MRLVLGALVATAALLMATPAAAQVCAPDLLGNCIPTRAIITNGAPVTDRNPMPIGPKGSGTIQTGQVSVGTSATMIAAGRPGRQKIGVAVTSAVQCAFGGPGVTLSTGWPLAAVAYASDSWDTAAALYAVCAASATIAFREQY